MLKLVKYSFNKRQNQFLLFDWMKAEQCQDYRKTYERKGEFTVTASTE